MLRFFSKSLFGAWKAPNSNAFQQNSEGILPFSPIKGDESRLKKDQLKLSTILTILTNLIKIDVSQFDQKSLMKAF